MCNKTEFNWFIIQDKSITYKHVYDRYLFIFIDVRCFDGLHLLQMPADMR